MKIEEVLGKTADRTLAILEEKFHYRIRDEQKKEIACQIRQESNELIRDRKENREQIDSQ